MDDRVVFYRHKDHNFFPTLSFVLGRAIAFIPQAVMDITTFGTLIYFLVGLELDVAKFFTFYAILLVFTIVMSTMLSVATSIALNKSAVQAMSAIIILLNMFFCGFFGEISHETLISLFCPSFYVVQLMLKQFTNMNGGKQEFSKRYVVIDCDIGLFLYLKWLFGVRERWKTKYACRNPL